MDYKQNMLLYFNAWRETIESKVSFASCLSQLLNITGAISEGHPVPAQIRKAENLCHFPLPPYSNLPRILRTEVLPAIVGEVIDPRQATGVFRNSNVIM